MGNRTKKFIYKNIDGVEKPHLKCTQCLEMKLIEEFHVLSKAKTGRQSKCKQCKQVMAEARRRSLGQKKRDPAKIEKLCIDGVEVEAKKCSSCKVVKALDDFQKREGAVGGRFAKCRSCNNKTDRRKTFSPIKKFLVDGLEIEKKFCTKCETWLVLEGFRKAASSKTGYRSQCKSCEYQYRLETKEDAKIKARQRYHQNKEKYQAYSKEFRKNKPDIYRLATQRRLARKRGLPNDIRNGDLKAIKKHFGNKCALTDSTNVSMEHFIPISWGHGGNIKANLYLLDQQLNSSKSNENPFEWITRPETLEKIDLQRWEKLLRYLAEKNEMSVEEFRDYVYWCEENKRDKEAVQKDTRLSSEIYKETKSFIEKA